MANLKITEILLAALTWLIKKKPESVDYTPDVADPTIVTYRTFKKKKKKKKRHVNSLTFEVPLPWFLVEDTSPASSTGLFSSYPSDISLRTGISTSELATVPRCASTLKSK